MLQYVPRSVPSNLFPDSGGQIGKLLQILVKLIKHASPEEEYIVVLFLTMKDLNRLALRQML